MLACGHDKKPFGPPICDHLRGCRAPWLKFYRWYTGACLDMELLCEACADDRQAGRSVAVCAVCEGCLEYASTEVGDLVGVRGKPGIRMRSEPFNTELRRTALPKGIGTITDLAPVGRGGRSTWLMLAADGMLGRFEADTGEWTLLGSTSVDPEPDREPWCGHVLKRRLHADPGGDFAAVVNDYGRYGQIIDLQTGKMTLALDGGDYHQETVPLSFAFARVQGRVLAVHRTAWNRLDVSDPSTGALVTERHPTAYLQGQRPEHYLDYFHGALHLSPSAGQILDDGWVWHPAGIPLTWSLENWLTGNVWESEDGPTMRSLCQRDYYWDHAMTWLDERRVAVGGIGDDDDRMVDGVQIFDTASPNIEGRMRWLRDPPFAFAGPAGRFFSDGRSLFSSDRTGLSRWDVRDGARTGLLEGFQPSYHHPSAGELVQLDDGALVRWLVGAGAREDPSAASRS